MMSVKTTASDIQLRDQQDDASDDSEQFARNITQILMSVETPGEDLAPVVQRLDNAIHRINRHLADKC